MNKSLGAGATEHNISSPTNVTNDVVDIVLSIRLFCSFFCSVFATSQCSSRLLFYLCRSVRRSVTAVEILSREQSVGG